MHTKAAVKSVQLSTTIASHESNSPAKCYRIARSPRHPSKNGSDCYQEGPRRTPGGSTKLDLGPKHSGVHQKSLPVSSVIYAFSLMSAHTDFPVTLDDSQQRELWLSHSLPELVIIIN